jgi:hypothetical protein
LLTIAVVALELGQTILEEEVQREVQVSAPTRVRRFLSWFMVVVTVALSIETLVADWNAYVANLELQGQGTFYDARPERPEKIPGCCPCWFRQQAERDGHGDRETRRATVLAKQTSDGDVTTASQEKKRPVKLAAVSI